jgi:hypothetical protein
MLLGFIIEIVEDAEFIFVSKQFSTFTPVLGIGVKFF